MNAIQIENFGRENVLKLKTVDLPKVTDSTILVKIGAAGVNPVDTYIREGAFSNVPELPFTPGKDGSGVVQEIGSKITKFKVGDRVFICGRKLQKHGTYAEYSLVPEVDAFPLDGRLSFEEGACLGIPYFTAYRALKVCGNTKPGDFVLVHGASGAVGLACLQIGAKLGVTIIGTAGTEEGMALVEKHGAHHVLCHRDKNYLEKIMEITGGAGVNLIVEMLANVNLDKDLDILARKGHVLVVGSRGPLKIDPRKMMMPESKVSGVALLTSSEEEWSSISDGILKGIKEGWVQPVVDKTYALQDAAKAHHDVIHSLGAKGKLVLSVQEL